MKTTTTLRIARMNRCLIQKMKKKVELKRQFEILESGGVRIMSLKRNSNK